uniref:Putative DNA polymerase n=1 Tax=viral metagenome TaxID=1070528 RepID=A0A6M3KF89_9ZZZZ
MEEQATYNVQINPIAFDLETIADASVIPHLPPVDPDSRLKDPEKIKENIKEKKEKQKRQLALQSSTCRICCFGWFDGKQAGHILLNECENNEAELLVKAWEILAQYNFYATFNGNEFDVPVLLLRSLIHRIRPSVNIDTRRYQIGNHCDVRAVLGRWQKFAEGTLDFYARVILGEPAKNDLTGDQVQDYWEMEMFQEVADYCENDCRILYRLWELVQKYYLL